jgi:hypothetical protein
MATSVEEQIREICLSLPETTESESHGKPGFFANKQFVMLWPHDHHLQKFTHLRCVAPEGAHAALIESESVRFFYPSYVGHRGWIEVRLDGDLDIEEIESLCVEAHRCVATKRQLAQLDGSI